MFLYGGCCTVIVSTATSQEFSLTKNKHIRLYATNQKIKTAMRKKKTMKKKKQRRKKMKTKSKVEVKKSVDNSEEYLKAYCKTSQINKNEVGTEETSRVEKLYFLTTQFSENKLKFKKDEKRDVENTQ